MTAAPVNQLVGRVRAFICHETYLDVRGFCFAKSAGKARMIAARAGWEADMPVSITTIKVRRCPDLDNSMPSGYINGFLSLPNPERSEDARDGRSAESRCSTAGEV